MYVILGNMSSKMIWLLLVLFLIIPSAIYIYLIYSQESFTNSENITKQPGTYVMTNTTYDTNGNIIVKTMDTSGNFSVNTYGSTIINQTPTSPPPTTTNTATATAVNPAAYQMQLLPAVGSSTPTSPPVITSNDISSIASAAIAAAMNAYHQSQGTVTA
jgi:hypothetical protein